MCDKNRQKNTFFFHMASHIFHPNFTKISLRFHQNFTQTSPTTSLGNSPDRFHPNFHVQIRKFIGFVDVSSRRPMCHNPRQPRASGRARTAGLTQPKAAPDGQGDRAQSSPVRAGAHEHQTMYLCYASELCLDVSRKPSLLIQPIPQLRHASVYKIWQTKVHIAALLTWPA